VGRIKRGGGDGGEPVQSPPGRRSYADCLIDRLRSIKELLGRADTQINGERPTEVGTPLPVEQRVTTKVFTSAHRRGGITMLVQAIDQLSFSYARICLIPSVVSSARIGPCTHKIRPNVRFSSKAIKLSRGSEMTRCANYRQLSGRLAHWGGALSGGGFYNPCRVGNPEQRQHPVQQQRLRHGVLLSLMATTHENGRVLTGEEERDRLKLETSY